MSWSWYVYTAKSAQEVVAFDAQLDEALSAFLEDKEIDDELAEPGPGGGAPPTPAAAAAAHERHGQKLSAELLARLATCKTTYELAYVRSGPEESPLQVSVLKTTLEALAPCVMDWGDVGYELGEVVLGRLGKMRSRGRLVATPPPVKRVVKRRAAKPGEVRAARILEAVALAAGDPEAALDLRDAVAELSPVARLYLSLLLDEGALTDARARKALSIDAETLAAAAVEVEAAVLPSSR